MTRKPSDNDCATPKPAVLRVVRRTRGALGPDDDLRPKEKNGSPAPAARSTEKGSSLNEEADRRAIRCSRRADNRLAGALALALFAALAPCAANADVILSVSGSANTGETLSANQAAAAAFSLAGTVSDVTITATVAPGADSIGIIPDPIAGRGFLRRIQGERDLSGALTRAHRSA
jgi:hypothetical protein